MPLHDFPTVVTIPVQWGDQDALGHVNNTVALKWFETGRVKYLESLATCVPDQATSLTAVLAAVTCNFRQQLQYPDTVQIGSRLVKLGRTSITLEHHIYSEANQGIAADGQSVMVLFDFATQKPMPITDEIRKRIDGLENRL